MQASAGDSGDQQPARPADWVLDLRQRHAARVVAAELPLHLCSRPVPRVGQGLTARSQGTASLSTAAACRTAYSKAATTSRYSSSSSRQKTALPIWQLGHSSPFHRSLLWYL